MFAMFSQATNTYSAYLKKDRVKKIQWDPKNATGGSWCAACGWGVTWRGPRQLKRRRVRTERMGECVRYPIGATSRHAAVVMPNLRDYT